MADLEKAAAMVGPLARKWDKVGGLLSIKKELENYILNPIRAFQDNKGFGVDMWTGILLYGPTGCGKTIIVKAVADEAGANFISVQGLGMLYEVDKDLKSALRTIFNEARACTPCILFFDHVDVFSLKCREEGKYVKEQLLSQVDVFSVKCREEGKYVKEQLLSQLLTELEKLKERRGVYVIGATDRPDLLDPALLSPRGFGKMLHVPLPSPEERGLILTAIDERKKIDVRVDVMALGQRCEGFSGADMYGLMVEAIMFAVEDKREGHALSIIKEEHFEKALKNISPSVDEKYIEFYENFSKRKGKAVAGEIPYPSNISYP